MPALWRDRQALHAQEQHPQVPRLPEEIHGSQRDDFRGQQDQAAQMVHGDLSDDLT